MPNFAGGSVLTVLFSVLMGGMSLGQAAPLLQVCSLTTHRRASAHLQLPSSHCGRPVCISETCHIPHAALHHRQDCWSQGVEGTDQTDRGARPPAVNTTNPHPDGTLHPRVRFRRSSTASRRSLMPAVLSPCSSCAAPLSCRTCTSATPPARTCRSSAA